MQVINDAQCINGGDALASSKHMRDRAQKTLT